EAKGGLAFKEGICRNCQGPSEVEWVVAGSTVSCPNEKFGCNYLVDFRTTNFGAKEEEFQVMALQI
ncbi:unnamed protein product, partial [Brassica napus]